jgi:myo-inositol-1(or 4)-monophosphatase
MDLEKISRVGTAAAYCGAKVLKKYFGRIDNIHKKGRIDLVTEADIESERKIVNSIRQVYPDHSILAEEGGLLKGAEACQWIIDPLDGTTNFAHGIPICAVSIAFVVKNQASMGIVLNPFSGEFFTATRGQGARLNGMPIHVSNIDGMINALLATGFPQDTTCILDDLMAPFKASLEATQGVRRLGSAALDLCYVACGRFDGFWHHHLNPWDTAAGALMVTEAGGRVTGFRGQVYNVNLKQILATNDRLHHQMLNILSKMENG